MKVPIPETMEAVPFRAPRMVELPDGTEIPLLPGDGPDSKRLQKRTIAHVKVFDLAKEGALEEIEAIWQLLCDGAGFVSENKTDWNPETGSYMVFLRWGVYEHVVPKA